MILFVDCIHISAIYVHDPHAKPLKSTH